MGFVSSQRQQLKGWELPLAGLLLTAGLAVTVAAVKTTASQHKEQAVNVITVPSTLETAETRPQEPALDSPSLPSTVTAEPPLQEPAVDSPKVASAMTAEPQPLSPAVDSPVVPPIVTPAVPQPLSPAVESSAVAPRVTAAVPQPRKQAVASSAVTPRVMVEPQPQKQAVESPTVPSTEKAAQPQLQEPALDSPAVAKPSIKWNRKVQESNKPTIAQAQSSAVSIADGTYLYGQASQPGQFGQEYIVFESRQGKVVGAMYMPSSEYACFYGTLNSKQMNLTVVNPYNQTAFSHSIAREQSSQIAAAGGQINLENTYDSLTYPHSVGLEGYQPINQVGDNDKQILSNCLNKYQAQVWKH
jgi:hypothetical protein